MDPPEDQKNKKKKTEDEAEEEEESWCAIRPDDPLWPEDEGEDDLATTGDLVSWCHDDRHDHHDDDDSRPLQTFPQFPDSRLQFPESTVGVPICSAAADMGGARGSSSSSRSMPAELPDEYRQLHLGRQESLELLAESWAHLVPVVGDDGGEIEATYSHEELRHFQEDLEQFLFVDPSGAGGVDSTETMSTSSLSIGGDSDPADRESDPAVVTSSGESSQLPPSPAGMLKRKERLLACESPSPPQQPPSHQEPQSPIDKQQKKFKGSEQALPRTRPRYAIQTRTEVDVIDDGYRWRKYGQKPVKNSAHPRNYYRCTTANCPVRKRVERSTENPSHVLTTYDGTHTHPENVAAQREPSSASPPADAPWQQQVPLGPPRLPPSNYIAPNIIGHLLAAGAQAPLDQRRWSGGTSTSGSPPGGGSGTFYQQSLNLLRAHQFFRMRYGTQYPLLSNMLNLMRNFQTRSPPAQLMDPLATLMAAQSYYTMHGGPSPNLGLPANQQPAGTSTRDPVSMQQRRLLWIQALMGENLLNVEGPLSSSPPAGQPQHQQPMPSDNLQGEDDEEEDDPDNVVGDPT